MSSKNKIKLPPKNNKQIAKRFIVVNAIFIIWLLLFSIIVRSYEEEFAPNFFNVIYILLYFPGILALFFVASYSLRIINSDRDRAYPSIGKIDFAIKFAYFFFVFALYGLNVGYIARNAIISIVGLLIVLSGIVLYKRKDCSIYYIDSLYLYYKKYEKDSNAILTIQQKIEKHLLTILIINIILMLSIFNIENSLPINELIFYIGNQPIAVVSGIIGLVLISINIYLQISIFKQANILNIQYILAIIISALFWLVVRNFISDISIWALASIGYLLISSIQIRVISIAYTKTIERNKI